MEGKKYIGVQDLEIYKLARELSKIGWEIYQQISWQDKKVIGDQFIRATDSFGANIVEGYRRYHYLEKIKFFYNSRASLAEADDYWMELLLERKLVSENLYSSYKLKADEGSKKLQNFINSIYKTKNGIS
jgi:four helix bundle protein